MESLLGVDIATFIQTIGLVGVLAVVFVESGLVIGFFLPGDSLLFTAGFLASQGYLNLEILIAGSVGAAVAGYLVSYEFGKRVGPTLFTKENSFFFNTKNLERTQRFYDRHGTMTIFLARFMPVIRTFAPILAGVGRMKYRAYVFYAIVGAFAWAAGLPLLGYGLGATIPDIDRYLLPIVIAIIVISFLPTGIHILRDPEYRAAIRRALSLSRREVEVVRGKEDRHDA